MHEKPAPSKNSAKVAQIGREGMPGGTPVYRGGILAGRWGAWAEGRTVCRTQTRTETRKATRTERQKQGSPAVMIAGMK
jgi:hypothetical protein